MTYKWLTTTCMAIALIGCGDKSTTPAETDTPESVVENVETAIETVETSVTGTLMAEDFALGRNGESNLDASRAVKINSGVLEIRPAKGAAGLSLKDATLVEAGQSYSVDIELDVVNPPENLRLRVIAWALNEDDPLARSKEFTANILKYEFSEDRQVYNFAFGPATGDTKHRSRIPDGASAVRFVFSPKTNDKDTLIRVYDLAVNPL